MKKSNLKSLAFVFALFLTIASMSSCNKGYGCPGELTTPSIVKLF